MKFEKGEAIAKIMQWAWNAGLTITLDQSIHVKYDPLSQFNSRQKQECWPVIRFTNGSTHRFLEVTACDFAEMILMLEHRHKGIFADLGCPIFPKDIK